jgi:hypothetical protein
LLKRTGDLSRSEELLQKLLPGDAYGAPLGLAHYYLYCGELEKAIHWSEKAITQRLPAMLFFLNVHAQFVRSSPHLAKLLNLPEGWWKIDGRHRSETICTYTVSDDRTTIPFLE